MVFALRIVSKHVSCTSLLTHLIHPSPLLSQVEKEAKDGDESHAS